jgi:hypothetical protein
MKYVFFAFLIVVFGVHLLHAQSTTVKLPTPTSASDFTVTDSSNNVLMRMQGDGGWYLQGTFNTGTIPIEGAGTRLLWYPKKAAFRAGNVSGTQWNDGDIGSYSAALGWNTKANGNYSTAFGYGNTASGSAAVAFGNTSTALGNYALASGYNCTAVTTASTAMGYQSMASGDVSTAMGFQATASGHYSTAMGRQTSASGDFSTAMGYQATASGSYSTAIGRETSASGYSSTAMGAYVSTDSNFGSFIFGDYSTTSTTTSTASNQMTMRFHGGYRLFTHSNLASGVSMGNGANSWSTISDSTKKTNFKQADGEYFLSSLSKLKLGSWNYTSQDPQQFRHYGPMAQEIFHYFGHDGIGTIGNDTTLATADMDGIIMICLQALEKRTRELKEAQETITRLNEEFQRQQAELAELKNAIRALTGASDQENQGVSISEKRNR